MSQQMKTKEKKKVEIKFKLFFFTFSQEAYLLTGKINKFNPNGNKKGFAKMLFNVLVVVVCYFLSSSLG
jgi:hypothetical protein